MHFLKDEDLRLLINWKGRTWGEKRLKVLVVTLLDTGLRIDEGLSVAILNKRRSLASCSFKAAPKKERLLSRAQKRSV